MLERPFKKLNNRIVKNKNKQTKKTTPEHRKTANLLT